MLTFSLGFTLATAAAIRWHRPAGQPARTGFACCLTTLPINPSHFMKTTTLHLASSWFRLAVPALAVLLGTAAKAQVNPAYEVATWRQFKPAAVTYTLDDNTSNQLPVALPLFNQYNFKTTLFTVTNWGPNWAGLRTASGNGHEVTSHTLSHPSLNTLPVASQLTELQQSKAVIRANVPTARCETIAYPNCNIGDRAALQATYIAGRVCSGAIESSSPTDFYNISSIIVGTQGAVRTAADFNTRVASARTSRGWCVFLLHGIDNDGGYSPLQSSELAAHLAYMNTNTADYWVATFAEAVKYIRERNAVSLTETAVTTDSLRLTVSDNLVDSVYNVPVTVRRALPSTWSNARVYLGNAVVASTITTVGGNRYIVFDAIPDRGEIRLAKAVVASSAGSSKSKNVSVTPNPFVSEITVKAKGDFQFYVYSLGGKLLEKGKGTTSVEVGGSLPSGSYVIKISQNEAIISTKVVKK